MPDIDAKAMLDDARGRDAALLALMLATDRQAMDLFRIYVTLGTAVATGLAAALNAEVFGDKIYPVIALLVLLGLIGVGSWKCLRALRPARITLPGRNAQFWESAVLNGVDQLDVLTTYFKMSMASQEMNDMVNAKNSADLTIAKKCGIAAFVGAALVAVVGWALNRYCPGYSSFFLL